MVCAELDQGILDTDILNDLKVDPRQLVTITRNIGKFDMVTFTSRSIAGVTMTHEQVAKIRIFIPSAWES